ncbi:MAG: response regulator [Myxacorys californica WJT36-NPBG1]|jgi:PAS domain S-box-containing protein|nr:response regulator [Myxacorys californica WJT36-NPBG1]
MPISSMQNPGIDNSQSITELPRKPLDSSERQENVSSVEFVGLVLQLADGTVQACNAAAEEILGMTFEQIQRYTATQSQDHTATRYPWQLVDTEASRPAGDYPARAALQTGQPCSDVVMEFYKPNGDLIGLRVTAQPLFQANGSVPYAVVTTFTEVSPQAEPPLAKNTLNLSEIVSEAQLELTQARDSLPQIVLCVDDNDTNLYITSRILQQANFAVWQAPSGTSALELANEQPDLIILDVKLPDIDGTEVCQRLKSNPATASIPILHVSAERITSRDKVEGLDSGADGYLMQPINPEELLATVRSLLRLRSAERVLRRSQERLHRMVETAQIGICFTRSDGELLEANAALLRMLGYDAEEQAQRVNSIALSPLKFADMDGQRVADLEQYGNVEPVEKELIRKDGSHFPVLISGTRLQGEADEYVLFVVDLSDRKQIEAALQQRTDDLTRANHVKDEFLAVLSHELRSPLNPILGWCRLLQTRKLDEGKVAEALATIERNAKLQTQLIDDLLDVSRILRGKLSLAVMPVDLSYVIRSAIETVRLAAEAKAIKLEAVLQPNVMVMGDPARLQQVVWNLLTNAVKFTPNGNRVEVRLSQIDANAQIQVSDTGRGINAEFLPHVFDYFQQQDSATTRKFGGLGLGLAIVRQLVESHGGTVQAESGGDEQGATFTVYLPILAVQSSAIAQAPDSTESLDLNGVHVMVVDDEPDSLEFVAFVLKQSGAQVTTATSAIEVLQALPQLKPDVLVSDIGMPEIDGYMLIRQIRMLPTEQSGQLPAISKEICRIPAIALTAYAGEANHQQALDTGFQWHLSKPVEPDELVAIVAKLAEASG